MTFDLVIANPPYGKIGSTIVNEIIENVDFKQYINLLPANDYKRVSPLWQHVYNIQVINKGFSDASVTTHIAEIKKEKENISKDIFEISSYSDKQLYKYFPLNLFKIHESIDNPIYKPKLETFKDIDIKKCLFIDKRVISNKHLPYSKNVLSYKWNMNTITKEEVLKTSAKSEQKLGNAGDFILVEFATEKEKNNIVKFLYSEEGFKFFHKLALSMNKDSYISPKYYLPKVNWLYPWSLSEILREYNYLDYEVREIVNNLPTIEYKV